jgi:putative hydrolase of the HAD superfamily
MQRYSIFLTPSGADFTYTDNLIREMCGKYDGPAFEPHVTVYSGEFSDLDALRKVVSDAVYGVRPFSLCIRKVGCGEEYFKSLYIEFEENPVLLEIHERIRAGVKTESRYELVPHLSLLYSDMPLRHKEALAKRIVPDRPSIHFDKVKIVAPRNREEGWRDTGQWQTLFRARLGDAGRGAPVRAVIFDYGGVLAEEGFRGGLHAIARGQGLDSAKVHRTAMDAIYDCGYISGHGSEAGFWAMMRDRTGIHGEDDALSREILRRFVLRPRVMEAVRRLRGGGIITAILSDQTDWLVRLDRRDDFFREFDRVFNSYDLGKGKRDPRIFDDVVAVLGIAPREALFIDDMPSNVERAKERGLQAILCTGEEELLRDLEQLYVSIHGA